MTEDQFLFFFLKSLFPGNINFVGYQCFLYWISKRFLIILAPPPPQFFWWSQIGDHPQEGLAKFGYRPYMKAENFKNPFTF